MDGFRAGSKDRSDCSEARTKKGNTMIARLWRGSATPDKAPLYTEHFETIVIPNLERLAGHRGAMLLQRETGGMIEFTAITFWDSLDSIRAFAGDDADAAHVEPEARTALEDFDTFARNFDLVVATATIAGGP